MGILDSCGFLWPGEENIASTLNLFLSHEGADKKTHKPNYLEIFPTLANLRHIRIENFILRHFYKKNVTQVGGEVIVHFAALYKKSGRDRFSVVSYESQDCLPHSSFGISSSI